MREKEDGLGGQSRQRRTLNWDLTDEEVNSWRCGVDGEGRGERGRWSVCVMGGLRICQLEGHLGTGGMGHFHRDNYLVGG